MIMVHRKGAVTAMCAAIMCAAMVSGSVIAQQPAISGFLGDYSQLEPLSEKGRKGALIFRKKGLDLSEYNAIFVAEPLIYLNVTAEERGVKAKDLAMLSDYFHGKLVGALEDDYDLVDEPGPGVIVVRTAIIDVIPIKGGIGKLGKLALKVVNLDLGGASIEAEVIDGESGERLAALVEGKSGSRVEIGMSGAKKWGHAKDALKEWSKGFAKKVEEFGMKKKES